MRSSSLVYIYSGSAHAVASIYSCWRPDNRVTKKKKTVANVQSGGVKDTLGETERWKTADGRKEKRRRGIQEGRIRNEEEWKKGLCEWRSRDVANKHDMEISSARNGKRHERYLDCVLVQHTHTHTRVNKYTHTFAPSRKRTRIVRTHTHTLVCACQSGSCYPALWKQYKFNTSQRISLVRRHRGYHRDSFTRAGYRMIGISTQLQCPVYTNEIYNTRCSCVRNHIVNTPQQFPN